MAEATLGELCPDVAPFRAVAHASHGSPYANPIKQRLRPFPLSRDFFGLTLVEDVPYQMRGIATKPMREKLRPIQIILSQLAILRALQMRLSNFSKRLLDTLKVTFRKGPRDQTLNWVAAAGGIVAIFGIVPLIGWVFHQPKLIAWIPGFAGTSYSSALGLLLTSIALIFSGSILAKSTNSATRGFGMAAQRLVFVPPLLLIALGGAALIGWDTHFALSLVSRSDQVHIWLHNPNPHSGRMGALAGAAFIAIGMAIGRLLLSTRPARSVTVHALSLLVIAIGLLEIASEIAGFGAVFGWLVEPSLSVGLGFLSVGAGLLGLLQLRPTSEPLGTRGVNRVGYVAGAIGITLGLLGLVGGFAVLYPQAVKELHDELAFARDANVTQWDKMILSAWEKSEDFANLGPQLIAMRDLDVNPGSAPARAQIQKIAQQYRELGFIGLSFHSRGGTEVAHVGDFASHPMLAASLHLPTKSALLWDGQYFVRTRVDMVLDSHVVGSMDAERALDADRDDETRSDVVHFGKTLDFGICAPSGAGRMNCFPLRSTDGGVLRNLPDQVDGRFIPMHYALAGETGVIDADDYRGHEVIAAYRPIGNLGLGYVLNIDADQLYGPITHRAIPLLYLLPVLALGTVLLLRVQMLPVVRHMAESESRFRNLFDNAPIGMLVHKSVGNVDANKAVCEFLGYDSKDFSRFTIQDIAHPDDRRKSTEALRQLLRGDSTSYKVERRLRRKDGKYVWAQVSISAFAVPGMPQPTLVLQVENIEDRKRAQEALAAAKERLALALDASSLSIWEYDIRAGTIALDAHWPNISGDPPGATATSSEELMRRTHPDDASRVAKAVVDAIKGVVPFFQEEFRFRTASGEWKWLLCSGKINERDDKGRAVRAVGTNRDITEQKSAEENVRHWAYFDRLTDLPNRRLLDDRLKQFVVQAYRKQMRVALLFIDLDKFKSINDDYGHAVGDWLLRTAAVRMHECMRQSDTLARIGGDEFVAVLPEISALSDAMTVAEKIRLALATPFVTPDGKLLSISSSIGVALYPDHASNVRDLLRCGDEAMYCAKSAGRNAVHVFAPTASEEKAATGTPMPPRSPEYPNG